ncbi:MAG TPA: hypothetical protein PLV51_12030 [Lentimicrobium sp.]|jgi:hypothetical protein|nr:hypothetical protein [Lentimicrobium sp.]
MKKFYAVGYRRVDDDYMSASSGRAKGIAGWSPNGSSFFIAPFQLIQKHFTA